MKLKNKGITLIALVITIIILLILAGVTIGQLTGSGLFDKVKLAKEESDQAQKAENETLGDYENKIGEYIDGTRNGNENNYSTDEQVIGTWIDGSTIYSKTIDLGYSFKINNTTSTEISQDILPNDIYMPIKSTFYIIDTNNRIYGCDLCDIWYNVNTWRYMALDSWDASESRHVYLYLEYTKLASN